MTIETEQIEALQQTVFDLQEKLVKAPITCPIIQTLEKRIKGLEKRHAEDMQELRDSIQ